MDAHEFLLKQRAKAAAEPVPGVTVDELRMRIRELLLAGEDLGESLQMQKEKIEKLVLSDSPPDHGWSWSNARKDAAVVLGSNVPREDVETLLDEIDDVLSKLPEDPSRTPYEYWILGVKLQLIRHVARQCFKEIPLPLFDTLGIGQVNAIVKTFDKQHVLIFQSGAKAFSNLASRALTQIWQQFGAAFHGRQEDMTEERINKFLRSNEGTQALQTILHGYIFLGDPGAGVRVHLDPTARHFAHRMEMGMDLFIIAHEYSHILHGHPSKTDIMRRDKEIEADRTGIFLMMKALLSPEEDGVVPFCGAYFSLVLQELIMKMVFKISGREFNRGSYPSAFERCVNLLGACEQHRILTQTIEQTVLGFGPLVVKLCDIIEASLLDVSAQGRPLASIWRAG